MKKISYRLAFLTALALGFVVAFVAAPAHAQTYGFTPIPLSTLPPIYLYYPLEEFSSSPVASAFIPGNQVGVAPYTGNLCEDVAQSNHLRTNAQYSCLIQPYNQTELFYNGPSYDYGQGAPSSRATGTFSDYVLIFTTQPITDPGYTFNYSTWSYNPESIINQMTWLPYPAPSINWIPPGFTAVPNMPGATSWLSYINSEMSVDLPIWDVNLYTNPSVDIYGPTALHSAPGFPIICGDGNYACSVYTTPAIVIPPAPTVTLVANPTSIAAGGNSVLSWSGDTNAASCTGTNFSTGSGNPISGSAIVTPPSTTSYSVTCTGPGGSGSASATVTVIPIPALTASCSVSPTSAVPGQSVIWTAVPGGGTGSYAYAWSGSESLSGNSASVSKSYASTGTKTASVTVTSGAQSVTVPCSNSVAIAPAIPPTPTNPVTTCSADGNSVSFSWTASPGATRYYPRMYAPTTAQCNAYGWQVWTGDNLTCYPNPDTDTATSIVNFPITPGQNYAWWTQSANGSGTNNQTTGNGSFTCNAPDLTAGTVPNLTATVGTPLTLAAPVSNIGSAGTGVPFTTTFWTNTEADLAGGSPQYTEFTSGIPNGFPANYSETDGPQLPVTRTFNTPGIYYYVACADRDHNWNQSVVQSNPNNDCTNWGTISVQPAIPPAPTNPVTTCSPSGTSVSFSWTAAPGATNYYPRMYAPTGAQCNAFGWQVWTADNQTCYPNPDNDTSTSVTNFPITPGQNYNWYVFSGNSSGINWNTSNGAGFTCPAPPTISCSPSTPTPAIGQNVTWTPSPRGFSGTPTYTWTGVGGYGTPSAGTGSTFTNSYSASGSYDVHVSASLGGQTANADCSAVTVQAPTVTLTAAPSRVKTGAVGVSLTWTSTNTTACSITGNGNTWNGLATSGTKTDSNPLSGQITYTATCTTTGNPVSSTAVVNVTPAFTNF